MLIICLPMPQGPRGPSPGTNVMVPLFVSTQTRRLDGVHDARGALRTLSARLAALALLALLARGADIPRLARSALRSLKAGVRR